MGFPDSVLARNERVERSLHPHWATVVWPTVLGLLLVVGCILAVVFTPDDSTGNTIQWIALVVLVLVAIPAVFVPYLRWRTTHYVITSHRVMVRRGILTKTGKDITLSKITDVSFEQNLLDRIIGAGSLHIESAGDSPDEDLHSIPRSNDVQQLINRLVDEDDLRRRRHARELQDEPADEGDEDTYGADAGGTPRRGDETTALPRQERPERPERPPLAEERRRAPHDLGDGDDRSP
jgi:uncharacterized membrane protein YdbT with pleckstrin-like domain